MVENDPRIRTSAQRISKVESRSAFRNRYVGWRDRERPTSEQDYKTANLVAHPPQNSVETYLILAKLDA